MAASTPREEAIYLQRDDCVMKRPKCVTWAAEGKLNQVRLFAAEDAPFLSGSVPQDLLEAKLSKFKHISAHDLPPGFEECATKRAKVKTSADSAAIAMVAQIRWYCPERILYDPLWQVAFGNESFEATSQVQREAATLEAIYPRVTGIPPSATEPQEMAEQADDSKVLQIPFMPIEDEGETKNDHDIGAATGGIQSLSRDSGGKIGSPPRNDEYLDVGGQSEDVRGPSSAFSKSANPDVAAAAAAAYAVLKAKESGALIDHDLLIEILTNPLLIETLNASNSSSKSRLGDVSQNTPSYRANSRGNTHNSRSEPFDRDASAGLHSTHIVGGRERFDTLEAQVVRGLQRSSMAHIRDLNRNASVNSQGSILFPISCEQGNASSSKGVVGQKKRAYGRSYSLPPQDLSRDLIQQHGMVGNLGVFNADTQSAASVSFDDMKPGHDLQRHRLNSTAMLKGQAWLQSPMLPSGTVARSTPSGGQQERPSGPRIRKQCFFYNTAKGCRNGIHCNFWHEAVVEKPRLERTNSDISQHTKTSNMEITDTE